VALVLYAGVRRSRYFGNTAPLLMVLVLAFPYTTQVVSAPWMWALPFLFTFIGGVFSDALDQPVAPSRVISQNRSRKLFLALSVGLVGLQGVLCVASLAGLPV